MIAMNISLKKFMRDIVYQALEVTCFMFQVDEAELEEMGFDTDVTGHDMISSIVTFNGSATGAMRIAASDDLYDALAANMLGENTSNKEEKDSALCELANIICGNIVPYFAKNGKICVINPPQISGADQRDFYSNDTYEHEQIRVFVDEGIAEISIYFKIL
jgi:CheY-specific phosphatase CheX